MLLGKGKSHFQIRIGPILRFRALRGLLFPMPVLRLPKN